MIITAIISELRNVRHDLALKYEKEPTPELKKEIVALDESIMIVNSRAPKAIIKDLVVYLCPNCNARVKPGHTYCKKCAQALKRS